MRIEFLSKNYNPSEKLKEVISHKVERLNKFFEDDTKVKILLKKVGDVETLEITILLDSQVMRAEVSSDNVASENMYDNIDLALPKLEKQIIKHRTKIASRTKKFRIKELDLSFETPVREEYHKSVVKTKSYELTPMTVEDAIEELELVGHSFYLFNNKSTKNINVLYKRNDGNYGLIEALV